MTVHHLCAVPMGAGEGIKIPGAGIYRRYEVLCVWLGTKLRSDTRIGSTLNHKAISPSLHCPL